MKIDAMHLSHFIAHHQEKGMPFLLWIGGYPQGQALPDDLNFLEIDAKDIDEGQLDSLIKALLQSMTHRAIWIQSGDLLSPTDLLSLEERLKQQPARCMITTTQRAPQLKVPQSFFELQWIHLQETNSTQQTPDVTELLKSFIGVNKMPSDEIWNEFIQSLPEFFAKEIAQIDDISKHAYFEILKRLENLLSAPHLSIWGKRQLIWSLHSYMKDRNYY